MTRDDIICWLDLETTGSKDSDAIIEVGMALTDATPELNVLKTYQRVIRPAYWNMYRAAMATVVIDMHTKNGLIAEIDEMDSPQYRADSTEPVEQEIIDFLGKIGDHIPLAGSGVCHFDRKYIRRDFPRVDPYFTYWTYDVGVMRRMARLAGLDIPHSIEQDKPHRALDDTLWAIDEARRYLSLLGSLKEAVST